MKKLLLIALAIVMIFSLVACSGGSGATPASSVSASASTPTSTPPTSAAPAPPPAEPEPAKEAPEYPPVVENGLVNIAVVGTEIIEQESQSSEEKGYLFKIHYDVTNTSTAPMNLLGRNSVSEYVYQNEEQLSEKTIPMEETEESMNKERYIAPGVTARVACYYTLLDPESEVTLELPVHGNNDNVEYTLDPQNLLPPLPWPERVPVLDPELEIEGYVGEEAVFETSEGTRRIKLLGHEFFDHDGDKYIRISYELSEIEMGEYSYITYMVDNYTFQDGIQLGYIDWKNEDLMLTEEDQAVKEKIEPGVTTVAFTHVFKLNSDSPVLVRLADDYWSGTRSETPQFIGAIIPVE